MSRFKLTKSSLPKIRKMLQRQVYAVKAQLALDAYTFLSTFDYNIYGGDTDTIPFGLTQFMASNWNISINAPDTTVEGDELERDFYYHHGKKFPVDHMRGIKELRLTDRFYSTNSSIFVANSVPYALTLEQGGELYDFVWNEGETPEFRDCKPNRYIERATQHITQKANIHAAVITAWETCPEIH